MSFQDPEPRYFHEGRAESVEYFFTEKATGQIIDLTGVAARYILAESVGGRVLLDLASTDANPAVVVDGPAGKVTVTVDLTGINPPLVFPGREPKHAGAHIRADVELVLTPAGGKPATKVKGPALIFAAVAL